jgi:hypothetical protein
MRSLHVLTGMSGYSLGKETLRPQSQPSLAQVEAASEA